MGPEELGPEELGPEELGVEIRVLRPGDDGLVAAASHLFDGPARPGAAGSGAP